LQAVHQASIAASSAFASGDFEVDAVFFGFAILVAPVPFGTKRRREGSMFRAHRLCINGRFRGD
jgi:hypothetical protein